MKYLALLIAIAVLFGACSTPVPTATQAQPGAPANVYNGSDNGGGAMR